MLCETQISLCTHPHNPHNYCNIVLFICLTTLSVSSVPPFHTDSCISTLSGVGLQAGAAVIAALTIVQYTRRHKWCWGNDFAALFKNTGEDIQKRNQTAIHKVT